MRKSLGLIIFLLPLFAAQTTVAQYSCHDVKTSNYKGSSRSWYKSAFDNLRSDTIDVIHYDVWLDITDFNGQTIAGSCEVTFTPRMNNIGILSLDLLQLNIDSIVSGGTNLAYSYNDTLITIQLTSTLNQGDTSAVTVYYNGSPQQDASGWGGWYFSSSHAFNLGVGFAADPHNYGRIWHPCFDNFAERATYEFSILTSGGKNAYCNGERIGITTINADTIETTWRLDKAIPSYLASVAVSDYTHAELLYQSTETGDTIPIWLIAQPADTSAFKSSFTNIDLAIQAFEQFYGPHQWNKVGFVLVPFSSGAMEHATNIAYPEVTANGSTFYETLMAHELSHHWWGDNVTCLTEEEMWINEGIASYSEKLFLEYVYGETNYLAEMRSNHERVLHLAHIIDSGYYALNAVPHSYTYGEHAYNKGSDVAHTLRGYMGDSLFFVGLRSLQQNFGDGNLTSAAMRDHLNTIPGVNVTDFFEDWIMNPGFSHFSIDSYTISGSGPYTVEVVVQQKLKGTTQFHDNVPLQVRFMDNNWNQYNEEIMMSGYAQQFTLTCPFYPEFVTVNMDERVNDATTAVNEVITSPTLTDMPYAHFRVTPTNVGDSVMVRVAHNWVGPDPFINQPSDMIISRERYWDVHAVGDLTNFEATMRVEFNGQSNNAGYLDNLLLADINGEPFHEDSVVLLYRTGPGSNWTEHPNYTMNYLGSPTDKKGSITIMEFAQGQYAFGYRTQSVNIAEYPTTKTVRVYPNPAQDQVQLDLPNGAYQVIIHDMTGRRKVVKALNTNRLDVSHFSCGTYILSIFRDDLFVGTSKLVISD